MGTEDIAWLVKQHNLEPSWRKAREIAEQVLRRRLVDNLEISGINLWHMIHCMIAGGYTDKALAKRYETQVMEIRKLRRVIMMVTKQPQLRMPP